MSQITHDSLLTKAEACQRMRISLSALNTLLREQAIPSVRIGKRSVRLRVSDVDTFIHNSIKR